MSGMKQMEERHVAYQVDLMVWCNKLDLIALSNTKGEVQVHRLHWQKVWSLPPPKEASKVSGMAWRPDGKALAVGYSCGQVILVDVEDKETLHSFCVVDEELLDDSQGVTCLAWSVKSGELMCEYNPYEDASLFLPNPSHQNTSYKSGKTDEQQNDFKKVEEQNQLHILIFGFGNGNVHLSIFGKFPCGVINLPKLENSTNETKILNAQLSDDFSLLQVFYEDESKNLKLAVIETPVLSEYHEELFLLANKYSHIVYFMSYIRQSMTSIIEAWEHILLEMETKLANYAALVPEGGVSADLLDLLMTGVASDELELFLLQELTDKGLKKIGSSVELSYSIIQKLVTKQLNVVSQSLIYYLNELRGLARIPDRYEILGLKENTISDAVKATFAFMSKSLELQQVIHNSMRDYKSFFRWLYVVILKLLEEPVSSDIVKMNQQELTYIAEFLYNFDNVNTKDDTSGKKAVKFNLEKLAQYIQDKELTILPDDNDNPWKKFLQENSCLTTDNDTIFAMEEFKYFSLTMQQKHLNNAINRVFEQSGKIIGTQYKLFRSILCCQNQSKCLELSNYKLSQIYKNSCNDCYLAFVESSSDPTQLCLIEISVASNVTARGALFYFKPSENFNESRLELLNDTKLIVADLQFYSTDFLSVILRHPTEDDVSVFVQLPVKSAMEKCCNIDLDNYNVDIIHNLREEAAADLLDRDLFKVMDKMSAHKLAVSGGRKVAVVLSSSNRKVRIFEMEVEGEEDEDETLDTTPQSQGTAPPSDVSQQNISLGDNSALSLVNESITEENDCDISDENSDV